jgi:hypothetical protein
VRNSVAVSAFALFVLATACSANVDEAVEQDESTANVSSAAKCTMLPCAPGFDEGDNPWGGTGGGPTPPPPNPDGEEPDTVVVIGAPRGTGGKGNPLPANPDGSGGGTNGGTSTGGGGGGSVPLPTAAGQRINCTTPGGQCEGQCAAAGAYCNGYERHPYDANVGMGALYACKSGFPTWTCSLRFDNGDRCSKVWPVGPWICDKSLAYLPMNPIIIGGH